jgi:parvulin-like peptidyl-prolyl isomerase
MTWQPLVLSTVFVATLAGCGSVQPLQAANDTGPSAVVATADVPQTSVSRMQKPEPDAAKAAAPQGPKSGSLLDVNYNELSGSVEHAQVASRIRASVNGVAILDDEIRETIYPFLMETQTLPEPERSQKQKEIFEREMDRLIEREIILQDCFALLGRKPQYLDKLRQAAAREYEKQIRAMKKRYNLKSDQELRAALRTQGLSLEGLRRQVERNFMAREYIQSRIYPAIDRITFEQIQEYYQQHPSEFTINDAVKWQDIFIDASRFPDRTLAQQFAEDVANRARNGEDFHQLALKYDNGDSSYRNGEGFGTRRGEIKPPEAEPVLFGLKDGQIGPVIQLGNGFHIVRVVKREYAGLAPLDDKAQTAIRNRLTSVVMDREYKRIVAELKRKASVQISTRTP